jgi:outer membrane protein insertion porin family
MSCRAVWRVSSAALFCVLASLILAAFPSFPVSAQQQEDKSRLASVEVTGSTVFHPDDIVAAAGLHVGADVSRDDLQQAANNLAELGTFASVQYRYDSAEGGVRAQYAVTDAPLVPVSFDNFPWFGDDELGAALKTAVHLFDGKAPERGAILDAEAHALTMLLTSRGIPGSVSHALVPDPIAGAQTQQFRVDGADVSVANIKFDDALAAHSPAIQQRLPDLIGKPYSRSAIELFELEQLRPLYLAGGYMQAQFGPPVPHMLAAAGNSTPNRVDVAVPIEAGQSFVWGGVRWTGDLIISPFEFDTLVELRRGDPADGMKMDATWQAVRDAYARRGYLDAKLAISPGFDSATKRVAYSVAITAGPQYHMGKLIMSGLSIEGERRVRAAWKIAPGEVFDKSDYDAFISNGIAQALSGIPFHYDKLGRFLQQDPDSHTVDVLIDFQ